MRQIQHAQIDDVLAHLERKEKTMSTTIKPRVEKSGNSVQLTYPDSSKIVITVNNDNVEITCDKPVVVKTWKETLRAVLESAQR